jgi:hypothetical protein
MNDTANKSTKDMLTQISEIEANLAFFEARFSLIEHQPDSTYKQAQVKAYVAMHDQLTNQLKELKMKQDLKKARKA